MSAFSLLPSIMWKINGVTDFCKKKSPSFTCYGLKLKLIFLYEKGIRGWTYQVTLKSSGGASACNEFNVYTWMSYGDKKYFEQSLIGIRSALSECLVWEATPETLGQLFTYGFNFANFWNSCNFVCCIIPCSSWEPNDASEDHGQAEVKPLELSSCMSSFHHDFSMMFNNHVVSDVILVCGDSKIYAHTAILTARSSVFAAMFRNKMRESEERNVEIKDLKPSILEQLVRYMYTGETPDLNLECAHEVYQAADEYGVEALKMKCGVLMVENPGAEALPIASVAQSDGWDGGSKNAVLSHFANIKAVLCSDEWKKLSKEEPQFAHKAFQFFVKENSS